MGSFSWQFANKSEINEGGVINLVGGRPFKFLIPQEFGGGHIIDECYGDYGYLKDEKYDMYELLAFWNKEQEIETLEGRTKIKDVIQYDGDFTALKEIDDYTDGNRGFGIDIGTYNEDIDKLKYPLKIVPVNYEGTYEDCKYPSYTDPCQGFYSDYVNGGTDE